MKVCLDDMRDNTKEDNKLISNLEIVFSYLRKHNMRLNLQSAPLQLEPKSSLVLFSHIRESKQTLINVEQLWR